MQKVIINAMKYCYIILISVLFIKCKKHSPPLEDSSKPIEIVLKDNDNTIPFSSIVKTIEFIVLENTQESFLSRVNRVFTYNNAYYIFDDRLEKILVFSSKGNFIRSIGTIGGGPSEYKDVSDVVFDYNSKRIKALDIERSRLISYDLDGNFVNYHNYDFPTYRLYELKSGYKGCFVGYFSDDFYNLKILDKDNTVVNNLFQFPKNNSEDLMKAAFTGHITGYKDSFLYSDATSSRIYQISPEDKIELKYNFNFGNAQWDEDNIYKHETFFNKIQRGQLSFLRNQYEENDEALVFCYNQSNTETPKKRTNYPKLGFYLKKKKTVVTHFDLEDDFLYQHLTSPKGKTQDEKSFISTISNASEFVKQLKNREIELKINKSIDSIDTESTILVKYKIL